MTRIINTITFLSAFFGLLFGMPEVSNACTSFAVFSKSIYFGMNFDFLDPTMKFLISTNGDIRTFHLAFERAMGDLRFFVNTGGMNDKGLFAACQELQPENLHPREKTGANQYTFELYEAIGSCTYVKEIKRLAEERPLVDMPGITLHNLFADTKGRAIVTEAGKGDTAIVEKSGDYMVMTNFPIGSMAGRAPIETRGKGADRYIACHKYLERHASDFNIENGFALLSMCRNRDPQYPTACSMVCDPQNRDVYIVLQRDFSRIWKLSMDNHQIVTWRGFKEDLEMSIPTGDQGIPVCDLLAHAQSQAD
jgi:hypothetical protein